MPNELIDIVDENNQVIKQMMKSEAHQIGALHRCVIAQVIDSQGNWLFVRQAGDRQDAGQLVSPVGGHVRSEEAVDMALERETLEELGIEATSYKQIGAAVFNREVIGRKENHLFILYEIYSDEAPVLNHESVGIEKFTKVDLKKAYRQNPQRFGAAFHFVAQNFYPELL